MIVKKFLKGFMAAALAVTMAVTPVSSVKAAEVTVTSGASTYTFSQEPAAAFLITGLSRTSFDGAFFLHTYEADAYNNVADNINKIIFYCVPVGTQISSPNNFCVYDRCSIFSSSSAIFSMNILTYQVGESLSVSEYYHLREGFVNTQVIQQEYLQGDTLIMVTSCQEGDDFNMVPEIFAGMSCSVVQIPVADALAMDNANIQLDTANTQTAEAQAQAAQQAAQQAADAQAAAQAQAEAQAAAEAQAQQAAEAAQAQAQADALAAQQAADAAAQAQITAQPANTTVSQGTYTVEANDNLCKIAQKVYGDRKAWREIYKANPTIKDDYVIYKGQVLVIPTR